MRFNLTFNILLLIKTAYVIQTSVDQFWILLIVDVNEAVIASYCKRNILFWIA